MENPLDDEERDYLRQVLRDPKTEDILQRCFKHMTDVHKEQLVAEQDVGKMQRLQAEVRAMNGVQIWLRQWTETEEERNANADAQKPRKAI